jgi:uncharacterized membrane protein
MAVGQVVEDTGATSPKRTFITVDRVIWVTLVLGLAVTTYLSYVKLTEVPMVCLENGAFDCGAVQNSIYSEFMGIPIAYFGLAMYAALAGLMFFEQRLPILQENANFLMVGIGLFAWLYSMYLVYLQVVVLQAMCQWCLFHELNITILFPLLCYRLYQQMQR